MIGCYQQQLFSKQLGRDERSGLLIILITYLTSLAVAYLFQQGAGLQGSLE
ncbi:hypothetical protein [Streptococcus equi]|uniref:hypothetical protein n=1 Tax=Streptococcus equi TaxID=1336 RepID=UPI001E5A004B|nr:hypothetical protein [Streptococcus equi]